MDQIAEGDRKDLLESDEEWNGLGRIGQGALARRTECWFWEWPDQIEGSQEMNLDWTLIRDALPCIAVLGVIVGALWFYGP